MRSHKHTVVTLRGIAIGLAAMHLLPARKHLGLFFADPSMGEAWKGFGAIAAMAILMLPTAWHVRALSALRRVWWGAIPLGVLALVHVVPAEDHLPKLFASPSFGDAWRGLGSAIAILFFLAPMRSRVELGRLALRNADVLVRGAVGVLALSFALAACATKNGNSPDSGDGDGGAAALCPPCVSDTDCDNGSLCAQVGGDSYCTPACPNGNECSSDRTCISAMTSSGQSAGVCALTSGGVCAVSADGGGDPCAGFVPPERTSSCTSCSQGKNCQTNGCYGGWWCDTSAKKCVAAPADCTSPSDAGVPLPDAGPVSGTVGPNGGTLSRLLFAVVGDTRPPLVDDTKAYPSAIIQRIYGDVEALNPHPPFMLSTGDYNFASAYSGTEASTQMGLYATARANYSGTLFPAMGNHECTGAVASNCGPNSTDGMTNNYNAFLSKLLAPIQKAAPYYSIEVDDTNGKWTAKFVFIAANAWNSSQASWLTTTLSQQTTYTFIVRHEPHDANTAPGVTPSEQIMAQHPYTLCIVGHTHSYYHFSGREVLIGNGGAPLSGNKNYGYGLFSQRQDGAIQVDMIDYQTGLADSYFRFVVKPDGTATQ